MISDRLAQLQKFLDEDPDDPFNWYALALEYQKSDPHHALTLFDKLLKDFEAYIPTYYHAAHLYQEVGEAKKAVGIFEKGITEATRQHDLKTVKELRSALDELLF